MAVISPIALTGAPPSEVPLPKAPLIRVIAQVRFAPILAILKTDKVSEFQEKIRSTYPILTEERAPQITLSNGMLENRESVIWRFTETGKGDWRLSLGVDFIALETAAYLSRSDFLKRLGVVLMAVEHTFKPGEVQRLGLRYIDRLTGKAFDRINKMIEPKVLGISHPRGKSVFNSGKSVIHMLTEAQLKADEGLILARWGSLPENTTYDLNTMEPINLASWILDLDMYTTESQKFISDELLSTATGFAERIYSVFREMVTDEFLTFFGGQL